MDSRQKFENFLESFNKGNEKNTALIESIKKGFRVCVESVYWEANKENEEITEYIDSAIEKHKISIDDRGYLLYLIDIGADSNEIKKIVNEIENENRFIGRINKRYGLKEKPEHIKKIFKVIQRNMISRRGTPRSSDREKDIYYRIKGHRTWPYF